MLQLIANGIVVGSIIALVAIGLSMTFKILNFVNFSHGDFVTFGAYLAFLFNVTAGLDLPLAILASVVITATVSVGLDKVVWRPMRDKGASRVTLMIISIGLALALRNTIVFFWSGDTRNYDLPIRQGYEVLGITITQTQIIVVVTSVVLMIAIHYLLQRTKMGKAMRALSDNMSLARISGIDVDKVIIYTWIVGMSLASVGGILFGMITTIRPNMGWHLILPTFAAVILGGVGNPYGAMLGGMVIGLSQEISTHFFPSEYKLAVGFFIMILILLLRPRGIFGGTKT